MNQPEATLAVVYFVPSVKLDTEGNVYAGCFDGVHVSGLKHVSMKKFLSLMIFVSVQVWCE